MPDEQQQQQQQQQSDQPVQNPTDGEKSGEIRLTSEQLNDRIQRAQQAATRRILGELGAESEDALKAALAAGKAALDAQKTDAERQAEALRQAQERAAEMERKAREAADAAQQAALKAEAVSLMAGRFANPAAAFRLLDISKVKVDDAGQFTGLADAINALAEKEPWTLRKSPAELAERVSGATPPTQPTGDTDAERRARYFGGSQTNFFNPKRKP